METEQLRSLRIIAVVPAAGQSSRMGNSLPKPLMPLIGVSILERTLQTLAECREITEIIVLHPEKFSAQFSAIAARIPGLTLLSGGVSRQQSVRIALSYIEKHIPITDLTYILVHDAARCMVEPELVRKALIAAQKHAAVTVAIPMVDSIVQVSGDGVIKESLKREGIWRVQTPQVFRADLLSKAHHNASPEELADATDDAGLVQMIHPVWVVTGSPNNFKITTQEDFIRAERLLSVSSNARLKEC